MSKIKFLGESDENFTNGNIYQLVQMEDYFEIFNSGHIVQKFKTWITNNNNKLAYIPYSSIDTSNENWEFVGGINND